MAARWLHDEWSRASRQSAQQSAQLCPCKTFVEQHDQALAALVSDVRSRLLTAEPIVRMKKLELIGGCRGARIFCGTRPDVKAV